MINDWADDFIPSDLQANIISSNDSDHHERVGYTVDLEDHNYENDWQAAEDDFSNPTDTSPLLTGSVATDINGERQNSDMRLINTIHRLVHDYWNYTTPCGEDTSVLLTFRTIPIISYNIQSQPALLNHWQDIHYFLAAFPTLFLTGIGGHMDRRVIPVSLAAFVDWALCYHSRRFAQHKTFMYLIYDVIELRNSSFGNNLLIRRS
ncbi:hypothetical protein BJX66DRAFT_345523 [Aspergillus keveii]|uniref:Uncharacterized protein n=1 Tax=Aspergillus keveii TaxID=714993 RepID=A0ABR4FHR2_9EURO